MGFKKFKLERIYYGRPEAPEGIPIWDTELKIRTGLSRDAKKSPHPLWSNDEEAMEVVRSAFAIIAAGWPAEYVQADGKLIMPPREVFQSCINQVGEDGHERIVSGVEFYLQNFYPQEPADPHLRDGDPYYVCEYILKEHQV